MSPLVLGRGDPGVVRDVEIPTLVSICDPTGQDPLFRKRRLGSQLRVRQQGDTVLEHIVLLQGGAVRPFFPSWITVHAEGVVVPLEPIQ